MYLYVFMLLVTFLQKPLNINSLSGNTTGWLYVTGVALPIWRAGLSRKNSRKFFRKKFFKSFMPVLLNKAEV